MKPFAPDLVYRIAGDRHVAIAAGRRPTRLRLNRADYDVLNAWWTGENDATGHKLDDCTRIFGMDIEVVDQAPVVLELV